MFFVADEKNLNLPPIGTAVREDRTSKARVQVSQFSVYELTGAPLFKEDVEQAAVRGAGGIIAPDHNHSKQQKDLEECEFHSHPNLRYAQFAYVAVILLNLVY